MLKKLIFGMLGFLGFFSWQPSPSWTQDADQNTNQNAQAAKENAVDEQQEQSRFNLPFKTAGGIQVWTDFVHRDGYRIQENCLTGHFRLLDPKNVRRAWGTQAQCQNTLDGLHPKNKKQDTAKRVTVLLHGLMRSAHSMSMLEQSLIENELTNVMRFSYASSRRSISDHAKALRGILEDQPDSTDFSFVGHSMGNIVVRHLIGDLKRDGDPKNVLPRCKSMVMLGPPNQGAAIARRLGMLGLFGTITGKGGMELGPEWSRFEKKLATPPFPFAIIAGDLSEKSIKNPLVDGANDFVVSLEEAKLEGSREFHTVPVLHSFLMNDETAKEMTVKFLKQH